MKTKIIPADELSTKTLLARDYVLNKYEVTYREVIEHTVTVHRGEELASDLHQELSSLSEEGQLEFLQKAKKQTRTRVVSRELWNVRKVEPVKEPRSHRCLCG